MDATTFDDLYDASFRRLVGQLYAMIGDREEAADCVQEAFARAWAHRRSLDRAGHPEAWVRTTAYRLAVSRWRKHRRRDRLTDRALLPTLTAEAPNPDHVALVTALGQLPEAQRRALVLYHLADLPIHEVARETGVPEGTVKARLSRGRAALATLLDEPRPDSPEGARHA